MSNIYRKPRAHIGTGPDAEKTRGQEEHDRVQHLLDAFGYTWQKRGHVHRGRTFYSWVLLAPDGSITDVSTALAHIAMRLGATPDQETARGKCG